MLDDEIQYPSGLDLKDVISWGTTGLVVLDESLKSTIKTTINPFDKEYICILSKERQVYERLTNRGGHKGILSYYGTFESVIRLEYAPNHSPSRLSRSMMLTQDNDCSRPLKS